MHDDKTSEFESTTGNIHEAAMGKDVKRKLKTIHWFSFLNVNLPKKTLWVKNKAIWS